MIRSLVLLSFAALFLTACGPNYLYQNEQDFGDNGWTYQDSLVSIFNISDTTAIYDLELSVTHSKNFSFQNFYVRIHTVFPTGERLSEEVSLEVADKSGTPFGQCGSEACQLVIPIQQGAYFDLAGDYQITIEQFSRKDPLPGIQQLAFGIIDTGQRR